jgi:hypothetical protein
MKMSPSTTERTATTREQRMRSPSTTRSTGERLRVLGEGMWRLCGRGAQGSLVAGAGKGGWVQNRLGFDRLCAVAWGSGA